MNRVEKIGILTLLLLTLPMFAKAQVLGYAGKDLNNNGCIVSDTDQGEMNGRHVILSDTLDAARNFDALYVRFAGRQANCSELAFHLAHITPHERLARWLRDTSLERKGITLKEDYVSWKEKILETTLFDEEGVRLVDYGGSVGVQYAPTSIAQYALALWEDWCQSGNTENLSKFLIQAEWLASHLTNKNGRLIWEISFPVEKYGVRPPWFSAMWQGQGLAVLLRAWQLTGDDRFKHAADGVFSSLQWDYQDGGATMYHSTGVSFEEYPRSTSRHVLNGHMYTLFGVYDYYRATGSSEALTLFSEGVRFLRNHLSWYDTQGWNAYDLSRIIPDRLEFRFVMKNSSVLLPALDVDSIAFDAGNAEEVIDAGGGADLNTDAGAHIVLNRHLFSWWQTGNAGGVSYRTFGSNFGYYGEGPFILRNAQMLKGERDIRITIRYRLRTPNPVFVEFRKGQRLVLGMLKPSEQWTSAEMVLPKEWVTRRLITESYMRNVHTKQLHALAQITGEAWLEDMAKKWEAYLPNANRAQFEQLH